MIRSELYKMRHHATPRVIGGLLLFGVLAGPIYFLFKAPGNPADHWAIPSAVFTVLGGLLAAVYGAWFVGHEYRQDTLKRVVAANANRGRLLWVKGLVGLLVGAVALAIIAGIGIGAGALAAEINGVSLDSQGLVREFLGAGFFALGVAAMAYLASLLLRSDTYAIVAVLGLITILDPLLERLPKVGPYLPGQTLVQVTDSVSGYVDPYPISTTTAVLALALTLSATAALAGKLFNGQDL